MIGVALDPGSGHVGYALFRDGAVYDTGEMTPGYALGRLVQWLGLPDFGQMPNRLLDVVVCESFQLKSDSTDEFARGTVELIGVVRYLCARACVPLIEQMPTIKRPTAGLMKLRGMKPLSTGRHAKDAEIHAFAYLERNRKDTSER